jgi:tRNA modification GTPase
LLDRALVLAFPGPQSATGEDVVELHLHGGRAVVRALERVLAEMPGLRAAQPGEFTRRALLNGRIDLSEAEGLGDLLAAETEAQRRVALASAEGAVRRRVERWTARTLQLGAGIEALLDHGDEEDVNDERAIMHRVRQGVAALAAEIADVLAEPPVERLRDGLRVVLAGPPNSGKSTLFNALLQRDAAIISPIAGTTRDRIEAPVMRDGVAWVLIDTAGLAEETADPIEAIGIRRARETLNVADIVLWLGDEPPPILRAATVLLHARHDLPGRGLVPEGRIAVSALEGSLGPLWARLAALAEDLLPGPNAAMLNARQRDHCATAETSLRAAALETDPLIMAEEMRLARASCDAILGRAGVEDMLDSLFSQFCIGK